jgi:hypothetical protein
MIYKCKYFGFIRNVLRSATSSRFPVVFLGLGTTAQLVPKFHAALHASHAALPMVALNISPYINVTLTFDFGLDRPFLGIWVREPYTEKTK